MKGFGRSLLCTLFLLLGLAWQGVQAQQVRSLEIRDGKVYIDGHLIPRDQLPASLQVEGLEARYSFIGDVQPIVELNGRLYGMEGRGLKELGSRDDRVAVYFRDGTRPGTVPPGPWQVSPGAPAVFVPGQDGKNAFGQQAEVLQEQAQELEQLSQQLEQRPLRAVEAAAEQLSLRAQRLAQVAQELPQIEVQSYLRDIQQLDGELYERLLQEQLLEAESQRLAARLRALPSGREQAELRTALRQKLEEIFELKQQNRRREIEQLEGQLRQLQHRLQERERLRQQVIDKRLEELVEQGDTRGW